MRDGFRVYLGEVRGFAYYTSTLIHVYAAGAVLLAEGMGIIKGARHPAEAQKLYDFLASREGQEALFKAVYRRPIRQDIDVSKLSSLPAISAVKTIAIDEAKGAADQPAFLAKWKAAVAAAPK